MLFLSGADSKIYTVTRISQVVPARPVIVAEDPQQAENRVPRHFTGSEIIKLLKTQSRVLDQSKVTQYSKILEDSVQGKMHHLPLGKRLHRNISKGGGARLGDGAPGGLSKMRVTIFSGSQVVWGGKRYV